MRISGCCLRTVPEPLPPRPYVQPTNIEEAAAILGIQQLHPEQEAGIEQAMKGGDGLIVLPTGYGKSACYQIPAVVLFWLYRRMRQRGEDEDDTED